MSKMRQRALESEESFLKSQRRMGRTPHAVKAIEMVRKATTQEFFEKMLTDEIEAKLWMMFITGKAPKIENGKPVIVDGNMVMEDVELNPISMKAFLRAVEYKRGMPTITVKDTTDSTVKVVEINVIGATPQHFENVARARGLLTGTGE